MGVAERYKQNQTSKEEKTVYNGVENRYAINSGIIEEIENRVNKWLKNNSTFVNNAAYRAQNKSSAYVSDSGEWLSTITTQKNNFDREAESIKNVLNEYKDVLDPKWIQSISSVFDSNGKTQADIVAGFTEENSYWSQWENEDKYNEWVEWDKKQKFLLHLDVDAAKKQAETYEEAIHEAEELANKRSELETEYDRIQGTLSNEVASDAETASDRNRLTQLERALAEIERQEREIAQKYGIVGDFNVSRLKEQAANLRKDATSAEYKQTGEKLKNEALSAPDFETNTAYGKTAAFDRDVIKNFLSMYDFTTNNNPITDPSHEWQGGGTITDPGNDFFEAMSEEEKKILGYYIETDIWKADEYLHAIKETVGARVANGYAAEADTWYDKLLFSISAGIDQFTSGLSGLVNGIAGKEEYVPPTATQMASGIIRQDIEDSEGFWNGVLGVAYDLGSTSANMLPSILVGIVNPTAGAALMGASAGGNAYNEMINLGYNKNQARAYGVMVGASEALLERFIGGITSLGGGSGALTTKLLSKVDNTFARWAIQTGGSMLSEFAEESLQTVLEPWFKSIVTGLDYEAPNIDEILYSGLLGALSAGLLEGGGNAISAGKTSYKGHQIKKTGGVDALTSYAQTLPSDTEASKLASKVSEKPTAQTVGRLYNSLGEGLTSQNYQTMHDYLVSKGVQYEHASIITDAFGKYVAGEKLSRSERKALTENPLVLQAAKDALGSSVDIDPETGEYVIMPSKLQQQLNANNQAYDDVHEALKSLAKKTAGVVEDTTASQDNAEGVKTVEDEQTVIAEEDATEGNVKADTEVIENASPIKNIASIEDGKITYNLEDGSTSNNATASNDIEALVYESVTEMGATVDSANSILDKVRTDASTLGNQELRARFFGMKEVYFYGKHGLSIDEISKHGFADTLTSAEREWAYNLGAKDRVVQTAKKEEAAKSKQKPANRQGINEVLNKDGLYYDKSIKKSSLTSMQKASVDVAKQIHKILGVNVHLFASYEKNGRRYYRDANGTQRRAPNGKYINGDIYLDINAGQNGEGIMLNTLAHELTHHIEEWSPERYKKLCDFLMEQYAEKGVSVSDLVYREIAKAKKNGRDVSFDEAYNDMIANSLETMLHDGTVLNKLAQTDKVLFNKIKAFIDKIVDRIKALYADVGAESLAGKYVASMKDSFAEIQNLFADALVGAGENFKAATESEIVEGGDVTGDTDIDGAEGDHLLSDRSMVEGAGLQFIPTKKDGERILEYRVEDADGNVVTEVTAEMIKDSPLGNLVTAAIEGKYISKADAKVQYEFLAELVNMCLQYKGIAPVWETAGTLVFSAIKNNADKQYGKTIDFSTVCKKTQAIVDAMSEAMLRLGRGLTRAEVETIYLEVGKAGEETPCPVCYVFSRWMGIGGILDQMSRFQDKYVSMKGADIRAFMEDIEDRIDKRANTPNKKGELKANFFDKDGNIKQGQVIADLKNKASSKAASALKALSKNSDIKLQIQELEALAKTQDAKGKKATEKKIASLNKKLVDVSESEAIMKSANDEVELYEAYQWLTRTLMVKDANGNWIRNEKFKSVPKEVLFNLNKGDEFASKYPLSWAFRTGKGASAGKAIVPYADARVGETIQGIAKADIKDIEVGLDLNPFLNGDKQTQKKLLEAARLKQLRQNLIGGQRYQSTSDFRYEYGSDYLITFLEMQAIGAKVQLYTKVIEAVDFLATVGAECNLSVMPLSDGFITLEDGTKKLVYSSVTGINGEAAIEKTHQYNNVQLILVGISDEHIRLALEGDEVTFVIPFHGSGNSVHQIQALMNLLGENLDVTTAQDYTSVQSDHHLKKKTQAQKAAWNLRKKIIMGKAGTLSAAEHRILKENAFLDDMYRRFYEDESADEYGVALTEDQANQIFPYEYWDKSLTYDQADQNGERFKQYCATLGIVPRFSGVDSDGKDVGFGDFTNTKGYWKLLIDRRMYENVYDKNGNWVGYGKYHHPKTIDVTNFKAETIDPKWGTAHYGEVMAKSNDPKKTNKIVDAAIAQFENKGETMFSERDSDGNELSKGQQEFFMNSKVRDKNGNLLVVRHGTDADFNIFDFTKSGKNGKAEGYGFYFSDDPEITKRYGAKQKEVYLNITKPLYNNKRTINKAELIKLTNSLIDFNVEKYKDEGLTWQDSFISNYVMTYDMSRQSAVREFVNQIWDYNTTDQDLVFEVAQADGRMYDSSTMKEFYNVLTESVGYDGIIAEWEHEDGTSNVYVTFESNQSKNTTNTNPTENPDIRYSERDFSYNELVAKDDLQGVVIDKTQQPKIANGIIDSSWVVKKVREACEVSTAAGRTAYYVEVPDIGTNVEIIAKGLTHGFARPNDIKGGKSSTKAITNARVTLAIPQILKNSIEVNRSKRGNNADVPYTHVLIGTVALENSDGVLEYYAVRSMVQERRNQNPVLVESNILGKLTSSNAKKIDSPNTQVGGNTVAVVYGGVYAYRIADLLNDVKSVFSNTFSNDVYQHFGMARTADDFSNNLLFSERDPDYAEQLEEINKTLENENAHLKEDKKNLEELIGIQRKAFRGKEFKKSTVKNAAFFLMKKVNAEGATNELAELLAPYYQSLLDTKTLVWEDVIEGAKPAADWLLKHSSGVLDVEESALKAQDLVREVYSSYWKVSTLNAVDAKLQKRISELKASHKAQMDKAKERREASEQKLREWKREREKAIRKQYQDVVEAHEDKLIAKHQEQRERAQENRTKTEMRHKIKKVVNDLNRLLLHGNKERNVKIGLQPAVAAALEAINFDTVAAEQRLNGYTDENGKYHKGILQKIEEAKAAKEPDADVIAGLEKTRDTLQAQGDAMNERLETLRKAYSNIQNQKGDFPDYYREEARLIEGKIDSVIEKVGDTPLRFMTLEQLTAVYELYTMVLTTVRDANKVFKQGKAEDLQANASSVMFEVQNVKKLKEERSALGERLRSFMWNEHTPFYAFNRIGSKTLTSFFWELVRGQNVYAQDLAEANSFQEETRKKYGYAKWDTDKVHEFKLEDGRTFKVSLKQMFSIYAYSKRAQALDHMSKGGFFFNDKTTFRKKGKFLEQIKSNEEGYRINETTLKKIKAEMTEEQIKYVDEMQAYLTDMGKKGNEVTRVIWGIDIFKEAVYFPLRSVKDFIYQSNQPAQESSLKNDGMTKETKPHASNPIVLEAFDDVWASHVERMSQYHGFVIPIDNLNKILNYGTWANASSVSVSTMLTARYGSAVNEYLTQFIRDLNGSISSQGASNPVIGMVSKFKKTAVAASMSTVVQQPTAVLRATGEIDAKYFVGKPDLTKLSSQWETLKKYAPIAIIKEIGGFDAGSGRQATEWLNADTYRGIDKTMKKVDDVSMWLASKADVVGWVAIWDAVKRECVTKYTNLAPNSEEFLKKAGERFTEVIVKTQVYDSTLSRSGYMRSKSDTVKMATAFMGEPTLGINAMFDALVQAKRGTIPKGKAIRTIAANYASMIAASAAASLIYAMRDDDDDESYGEKYMEAFGNKIISDINPLTMLPFVKDIISIFDGWGVERTDMSIVQDIKDAFDALDSDTKSPYRKVEDLAGAIAALFGLPVKNVMRTGREIYTLIEDHFDGINGGDLGDAFISGITGEEKEKSVKLYEAIMDGNEALISQYKSEYKDEASYESAVKKALRENDERITEAAEVYNEGDIRERDRILAEIVAEGYFDEELVAAAIQAEANALEADTEEESEEEEEEKATSIYRADDINVALDNGDTELALSIIDDLVQTKTANGMDEDKARSSVKSSVTSYWKPLYKAAYKNKDSEEMKRIRYILFDTGLYGRQSEVVDTCKGWIQELAKEKTK